MEERVGNPFDFDGLGLEWCFNAFYLFFFSFTPFTLLYSTRLLTPHKPTMMYAIRTAIRPVASSTSLHFARPLSTTVVRGKSMTDTVKETADAVSMSRVASFEPR